jgi:multidrug efflux pump subunit AcrA (membrane-fusion protein)
VDIPRAKPKRTRARLLALAGGGAAVIAVTVALRSLEPAAPAVERATIVVDTVRRGPLVRQVRAPGTLVPEHVRIISAVTAGRVEQLPLRPGTAVESASVLVELSNPDVQLQQLEADRQLAAAEAALVSERTNLEGQRLAQAASVATVGSDANEAKRQVEAVAALGAKGFATTNEVARARDRAAELQDRQDLERRRLALMGATVGRQIALQEGNLQRLRAIAQFQRDRVASMRVVAGETGVLQEMNLELGQWVVPGQILARVAQPGRLKAVLRVPETQARDVVVGQVVQVDTRLSSGGASAVVPGRVMRVDPAVQNGTVTVEVALEGALPKGARGDLSVDGLIELERLPDVLSVSRPAYGQPESQVGIFRLDADGAHASRIPVTLGRASVNAIEIVRGLRPGDRVIVSDVSQFDGSDRLRIK